MSRVTTYDRVIIGAGLYGLYSALYCGKRGMSVVVLERDAEAFGRATYINQARVHMGYHYPRSLTTAIKSAGYFRRFEEDFDFCIHKKFEQIYATSERFSWTGASQFVEFCKAAGIRCDEIPTSQFFQEGMCDGAFLTEEYTYDAHILRDYLLSEIEKLSNVTICCGVQVTEIQRVADCYEIVVRQASELHTETEKIYQTKFILNATYASVNQIVKKVFPEDLFQIKYELCEIILCEPSEKLKNIGITVMDGPFFSIMPFGLTGMHSLTSVTFTPHVTSYEECPNFSCQETLRMLQDKWNKRNKEGAWECASAEECNTIEAGFACTSENLGNCNMCPAKPKTAWPYMSHLANKYMKPEYGYTYKKSLYSMKPILKSSEVDDSRPTAIRVHSGGVGTNEPTFISVLSGKINTVYDLDTYLA